MLFSARADTFAAFQPYHTIRALARSGKSVLHLDENQYYGGFSASLALDSLNDFLSAAKTCLPSSASHENFQWQQVTEVKKKAFKGTQSVHHVEIVNPSEEKTDMVKSPSLSRRCSIDLVPKVIWSRSIVIDTLIRAGVSRYMEFKTIQHLYMQAEGEMMQVPVSKADVFKTSNISLLEKRQLMKFITTLSNPDENEQAILAEYSSRPFADYAKLKKISERLTNFISYAIALEPHSLTSSSTMTTSVATANVLKFMSSVGRYGGHSPWIYPLFGVGDLCQSFSRLSAVYGAVFILGQHATEITTDKSGAGGLLNITKISVGETKNLTAKHVISNLDHLPELARPIQPSDKSLSRCVLITNKPMKTKENTKEIILSVIPPMTFNNPTSVYILQLDESASVVPSEKYLLQIWTQGTGLGAKYDLQPTIDAIASLPPRSTESPSSSNTDSENSAPSQQTESDKPEIMYCAIWSQIERHLRTDIEMPSNLTIVNEVNSEVGADCYFIQAQQIFERICPGEEFIPVVPNPEDIIWGGDEEDPQDQHPQDTIEDN
jgi:RAB protein geranylgeranyltransferase component A